MAGCSFQISNLIEAPLGGVPPPLLVLADLLQESLFWQVSDKFLSRSWQPCCAAGSLDCCCYCCHSELFDLQKVSCVLFCCYSSGGSLLGKCMFGTHIWQVLYSDTYLSSARLVRLVGKYIIAKLIWLVHNWKAYLASTLLGSLCLMLVLLLEPRKIQKILKNLSKNINF